MAGKNKTKNALAQKVELTLGAPKYVGYIDSVLATPVAIRIRNGGTETLEARVTLTDGAGLLVPCEQTVTAPFESAVELSVEAFSPLFLSENEKAREIAVEAAVSSEQGELCRAKRTVTVLPYDDWEGIGGNPERLACFVRPRLSDCARVLEEAGKRLRKWGVDTDFLGYTGADKNVVRRTAAAIFAAIKGYGVEKYGETNLSAPSSAFAENPLKTGAASALQMAVFAAACFEAAHLNPVIAVGESAVGVGVWLYESCFLDTVTDDAEIVEKYVSEGINNLSMFDVEDLFSSKNVAFALSETHFAEKLKKSFFEYFVDLRRCRIAGLPVLPLKGKGVRGVELVREADMSDDAAPAPLREYKKLGIDGRLPKNKQWERRLLDLTIKNPLLNFSGKNALHLCAGDPDEFLAALPREEGMKLVAGTEKPPFGVEPTAAESDLYRLERKNGLLRVYADGTILSETARSLQRRNREADEESGAKILYLALGFLRFFSKEDNQPKYSPLVLVPAGVRRAKGNEDFSVYADEGEFFVNATLLEYLKEEFNIDVRGLGGDVAALKISEIFAMVRSETAAMKGWAVVADAYLATFSFRRYLMWNDIHNHFEELKGNALLKALLNNRAARGGAAEAREEDDGDPAGTLVPLAADSSQYSAVSLSRTGESFVLHGPPGTGKSQTITNIIANALEDGKRVLFVAEKKAALDVVKKRLDFIGVGDFCLELHSNKTDKADVLRRLEGTLSLAGEGAARGFLPRAEEIRSLREELKGPVRALHKKRRLGISVYQAILLYLKNKDAPDVMDIESAFYDSLTERKLSECRNMILSAAAAAKECGGVFNSPFENVGLSEYSAELRDRLYCSSEVLITEIKHLRSFLGLYLEFYRQKLSVVTRQKLENMCAIARNLIRGDYAKYFSGVTEEELFVFYNSNRRLDDCMSFYNAHFKGIVDLGKDRAEIVRMLDAGEDWRHNKTAQAAVKKLARACLHPMDTVDAPKYLQTLVDIRDAEERIVSVPLAKDFLDRGGEISYKRRSEYLAGLYELHALAARTFLDYNPDSFNSMCLRAQSGYTMPVLEGYLKAYDSFAHARKNFLSLIKADREIGGEDELDYFSAKASALIDNIDMLANWCMYRKTGEKLKALGCHFVTEALENGKLTGENVLAGFEKNVYKNFLEINIPADPELSRMTAGTLEDAVEKFRAAWEEFTRLTREKIRGDLISRLPEGDGDESLSAEVAAFLRLSKSNLRGTGLRALFAEIPELIKRVAPCMLMSPETVAQYLQPKADLFDLVIFDEASQMTTAEAVGSIARAGAAVIVGDPRQLPPTSFFRSLYVDEDDLENEDLESVLDDCLALGMPERHLLWHYRSKHESLIAFSNVMYYGNKLCTFPSPDALESRVHLRLVDGSYDRGFTKRNQKEADALVREVVRRLKDPVLSRSSMGVVTFSSAQQSYIERILMKEILSAKLEGAAFDREEPLFVKNLENVQGDERDVILFSVCYGPDATGRVSLNFGPLNQSGGWRRLNVAVSRAREEMVVFSTMTSAMIDLSKTSSKGVAGLKAFLEFAEKGRTTLAVRSDAVKEGAGIGKYFAEELSGYGYECRVDVGASDFKIDVAVLDPRNKRNFLLAVIFDGTDRFSVKDRNLLQVQTLKRGNWNVVRVNSVNYYNNPKREVKRVKEILDRLTGAEKSGSSLSKYARPYRAVKAADAEVPGFITGGENDEVVASRLKEVVAAEEPISRAFLKTRTLATFGIQKSGARLSKKLDELIDGCAFRREKAAGTEYFYKNDRALAIGRFRTESGAPLRRTEEDLTPFEMVSFVKAVVQERVSVYLDELTVLAAQTFKIRPTERFSAFLRDCVTYGEERGMFVRSVSDRVTLA